MSPGPPSLVLGCLLATTVHVVPRSAVATSATPVQSTAPVLDYVAERECPARDRFVAQVEEAIDPSERARVRGARGTRIRVEIRGAIGGYRGTLEKIDEAGASAARVVVSPICADVAQALALTAAFSLAPPPPPSEPLVVARPAPNPPAAERAIGGAPAGLWSVAVGPVAGGWLSPGLMTGVEGGGERTFPFGGAARRLAASLRLRTTYVRNDWLGSTPDARFALWTGTLEACGLARWLEGGLEVGLCAGGESGWLRARGVRIANPRASDSWWLALGGGPLVRVAFGPRWGLELAGALRHPLRQVQFAFEDPAQTVGQTRGISWTTALSVAARFP